MTHSIVAESSLILTPRDFHIMEHAMRGLQPAADNCHHEAVGKAVIKLYMAGMTDPGRLADAASTMAATRLLDRRRWRREC
jgi:hypothetical protein